MRSRQRVSSVHSTPTRNLTIISEEVPSQNLERKQHENPQHNPVGFVWLEIAVAFNNMILPFRFITEFDCTAGSYCQTAWNDNQAMCKNRSYLEAILHMWHAINFHVLILRLGPESADGRQISQCGRRIDPHQQFATSGQIDGGRPPHKRWSRYLNRRQWILPFSSLSLCLYVPSIVSIHIRENFYIHTYIHVCVYVCVCILWIYILVFLLFFFSQSILYPIVCQLLSGFIIFW